MSAQKQIALIEVCDYFHIDFEIAQDFADFGLYPTVLFEGEKTIEVQYLEKLKEQLGINEPETLKRLGLLVEIDC